MEDNITDTHKNTVSQQLWSRYFPYWPIFLLLMAICGAGAWFYIKRTAPLYESTAKLLIKDEKKGIDDSRMIESLNLISTKKIVENEIEVLSSRALMNEVMMNLKLYAPITQKNRWRNISAYSETPVRIEVKNPDGLTETKDIAFSYDSSKSNVRIGKNTFPVNDWVKTPFGELKFSPVKSEAPAQGKLFFSLINPKKATNDLLQRLTVEASGKLSSIINLKFKDEDPKETEDVLNHLLVAYNRAGIRDKNSLTDSTFDFVQERLNVVGGHLDSIETKIKQYKSSRGAVDIGTQGSLYLQNVSENDQKLANMRGQIDVLSNVETYIKSKDTKGGIVPSTLGVDDPQLTGLLDELYKAELDKEKLKKTTGENSPIMLSLTDKIDKIKPSILEKVQNQKSSLQTTSNYLASSSNKYSSLLNTIPQKERDLVEISRQQSIESNIYAFLLQKREEAALSNSSSVSDNRVVDKAEASLNPVSPNTKLIYGGALILALGLGIALITGKELLNRDIMYRSDIEMLTKIPVIGEIGFNKSKNPIVFISGANNILSEQFRQIRVPLKLMGIGAGENKILITSSIPGEGKSFVAANLGLSLAMTGKKVIIIEADLTNPALADKLGVIAEIGLSSYLNDEVVASDIIKKTAVNENLFVIPAGFLPENPSELLMNGKLEDLMAYLEDIFDYILIDTAPVGALSDAYILTGICDTTLYVIRHGHTPRIAIERLDKNNKINELKNLAIIFNGVKARGFGTHEYGDGYGYDYVYGREQNKNRKRLITNTQK
jgi:tyrosine-protein kinase Etk/Wzc